MGLESDTVVLAPEGIKHADTEIAKIRPVLWYALIKVAFPNSSFM